MWLRQDKYLFHEVLLLSSCRARPCWVLAVDLSFCRRLWLPSVPGAAAGLLWQLPVSAWSRSVALLQLTWLCLYQRWCCLHLSVALLPNCSLGQCYPHPSASFCVHSSGRSFPYFCLMDGLHELLRIYTAWVSTSLVWRQLLGKISTCILPSSKLISSYSGECHCTIVLAESVYFP